MLCGGLTVDPLHLGIGGDQAGRGSAEDRDLGSGDVGRRNVDLGEKGGGEFARNKRYKLYKDGRFYDVANDVLEAHAIPAAKLDGDLAQVREKLQTVLNTCTRKDAQRNADRKKTNRIGNKQTSAP